MSNYKTTALVGLLLLCLTTVSLACTCAWKSPREHVCSSDFAVKVLVQWKTGPYAFRLSEDTSVPAQNVYMYNIRILRVLRSTPAFDSLRTNKTLIIPSQDNFCGKRLNLEHTYILTGDIMFESNIQRLFMGANVCNYIMDVTPEDSRSRLEVADLLNTSSFSCDVDLPDDDVNSNAKETLKTLLGMEP